VPAVDQVREGRAFAHLAADGQQLVGPAIVWELRSHDQGVVAARKRFMAGEKKGAPVRYAPYAIVTTK
jgi:hypothetical protein